MDAISKYLSWRPIMTVDQFWIAVLKLVPYEVITAYGVIRIAYAASHGVDGLILFVVDIVLAVACLFLYYSAAKTTFIAALSLAVCFFLFTLAMDVSIFQPMTDELTIFSKSIRLFIFNSLNEFYLLTAAVLIVLFSSSLRGVLGRPLPSANHNAAATSAAPAPTQPSANH